MSEGSIVEPQDIRFSVDRAGISKREYEVKTLRYAKDRVERELVIHSLDRNKGNNARLAEELGVSRPTLYDIMKKHCMYNEQSHPESVEAGRSNRNTQC